MSHACAQDKSLWRALLSSKVRLVFAVTFLYTSFSVAFAQIQDVTPPTLTAFSFTPTTINTATGPANVAVSLSATDDLSGVRTLYALFVSPSGRQSRVTSPAFFPPAANVSATATVSFPQFSETGTWSVEFVFVEDVIGNDRGFDYDTTALAQLGFPTKLVVGEQEDAGTPLEPSIQPDFDADGKTDIAVYRPSTGVWFILNSASFTGRDQQWGLPGDIPVPGDYDGDGKTDIAVYRPSTGVWFILNSASFTQHAQQWGGSDRIPVPGDYDGDGKTDIAVYRPSTGVWFILNSASFTQHAQQWGLPGDQPLPGQF